MGELVSLFAAAGGSAGMGLLGAEHGEPEHGEPEHDPSEPPWPEQRRLWWLLWSGCPGLGWSRLGLIEAHFGGWQEAWCAPEDAFAALAGFGPQLLQRLAAYRQRWGPEPLARLRQRNAGRRVLVPGDGVFPRRMRALERPPLALYWQGRGSLWPWLSARRSIAVVGTRRPSRHGESMAHAIGAALARAGWPVVSGLAEGIDAAAHRGCLAEGGRPVAVLGTPLERIYPRHHAGLQREVAEQGLLLSEQPAGSAVQAGHFAARNRLQVALAAGVVLVECPLRSGALQSAALAWREQLPLWVVPADAGKASAAGSNAFMAQGATVLLDPADLVRQLGPGPLAHLGSCPPGVGWGAPPSADPELMAAVGSGASLEQLCLRLGEPAAALAARLLPLELAGALQAEPGLYWRPL